MFSFGDKESIVDKDSLFIFLIVFVFTVEAVVVAV